MVAESGVVELMVIARVNRSGDGQRESRRLKLPDARPGALRKQIVIHAVGGDSDVGGPEALLRIWCR
ncbi:MAG TPA: hypothetical protein VFO34_13435 [Candidatus Acidoferrales bacterium]|nr:hypothetical protein [Candidatus Acidoferrales bacterium]